METEEPRPWTLKEFHWLTQVAVREATSMASAIDLWKLDADKAARRQKGECRSCHYLNRDRVAGQAFTQKPCNVCGRVVLYATTYTGYACHACTQLYAICGQCGGDMEGRESRVKGLPE